MSILRGSYVALLVVLIVTGFATVTLSEETYQKGTIRKGDGGGQSCDLIDGNKGFKIGNCGDFREGQSVDYRVKDRKVYIRRQGDTETKCPIMAELSGILDPAAPTIEPPKYKKGTIEGFEIRRDTHIGGGGGGGGGTPGSPVSTWTRHAKVYELHGTDLIYKVDYCGAFQAGQFSPGQEVEYRVAGDRVYIRHDGRKEYGCQLEGTRAPEPKSEQRSTAENPSSASAESPASPSSTAKLSITSIPDGADIEVDGSFSGNTPSDLFLSEGPHTVTMKKSGYKDWQRTLKVAAGSNIHLKAEMEKSANP